MFSILIKHLINGLLPWQCLLCHAAIPSDGYLCVQCEIELPSLTDHCHYCARILPREQTMCGYCLSTTPPIDRTYALFHYQPPIIQFITRLKFHQQLMYAAALSHFLFKKIMRNWYKQLPLPDVILPVPLHLDRLRDRGFNQAIEIARPLANILHIPMDIHGIIRQRATLAQSSLSAIERKKNLAGAFLAKQHYRGLSIAILDDVMTTSHTVFELAKVLKQQGAKEVVAWCVARR